MERQVLEASEILDSGEPLQDCSLRLSSLPVGVVGRRLLECTHRQIFDRLDSLPVTLTCCSFSGMSRLAGCMKLESVFPAWRRNLLQLPIAKIFYGCFKFSEMILDLKCIYLKFM